MGWGGWYPVGWMWIFWIVAIGILVFLIVRTAGTASPRPAPPRETPEDALRMRYARGEIDRQEFQQRLQDLKQR